ncbi:MULTISPECIES: gas vesicle protein GvpG [Halobacterium]|uniref:Gas vesicle protein G2 n=5 Tax=Halobacterium salinarum TaxID=2242 RepID=GVPG2_HALSA|nr:MULTISPECIES: gas vesicle protein GvpG [Halobacterium]P33960.1 RecName: Full=Gas vesicle protein G2; Short=GvpG2 [Halobacterium salinarum NRC-1]pir/S28137/ gas vesicle protein gvpG [imported] - Halobacterium salinarum [Halobacterium salinarum]MBB6090599.1 ABC-type uncharacterized transport system ATPase subunit [Halobacterium salinarum]MCF2164922.1 gas vesicle protein GvpG [Halobacterium salinarum]MCF2168984.1 gas vesicle protein GvpG [Halobacterium salinarum]MCF2207584.1 gas vesicle prote
MFVLDDLFVNPFLSLVDILQTMALDELYDTSEIRDQIKENQLLYEIGDRPADEYERRKQELEAQLRTAEQIRDQMRDRMEIKN